MNSISCSKSTSLLAGSRIIKDGPDSWKIHLMNMVDEFRDTKDLKLFLLPPPKECSDKTIALIAASVLFLSDEIEAPPPIWAHRVKSLRKPWFVSGIESLKAHAILESPLRFRSKNIFVLKNFLDRV